MQIETQCVHSGKYRDSVTRGTNTPIFTSSSYEYLDKEIVYPRYFNTPNQEAVVRKMCALEGAESGILFSSGMAAISTAVLSLARSGDHVVMLDELYGGTHSFATNAFDRLGIRYSFAGTDADAVAQAILPETKAIVIESPTNPLMSVLDIRRVAETAQERGITTIIDNTFASPINQKPLSLGMDIVVHSGTKYMGGHGDLCCGIALASEALTAGIRSMAVYLGGSVNAITCYLLERSLKTLALRVERQSANAMKIASFLLSHQAVRKVHYPGLPDFEGYAIARKQMKGFGGMLSFELDAKSVSSARFLRNLKIITPAVSLGGVETIICCPAETSHSKISDIERERIGISESLLRLSVGIENANDLIEDLKQALADSAVH
ncbi:MAG: aminotransferase class I/II-fold pyridoxal phosphate-dependent enzyme [Acidobacteria bacterium]|nr:aminotransferase class I/II-fold pyridoxal phosphate-dependent enzyme [Acidobacteriota bacterium]